jgi:hypothetical protein
MANNKDFEYTEDLKEEDDASESWRIASEFMNSYHKLMEIIEYPPLNLKLIRMQLLDEITKANSKMVNVNKDSSNPFDVIYQKFEKEIKKATDYKKTQKTIKKSIQKYLSENKNVSLSDFMRGGLYAE